MIIMKLRKEVPFTCLGRTEMVTLCVGCYPGGKRLRIQMVRDGIFGLEFVTEVTLDTPEIRDLKFNMSYITGNIILRDDIMKFIEENELGSEINSPHNDYKAAIFDMEKLSEFDRDGVIKFLFKQAEIPKYSNQECAAEAED